MKRLNTSKSTAVSVLGLGGLSIGTGEFAAMGLLPDLAESTHVSIPRAGAFISAYALGVVIGSPVLAAWTARMERRRLLMGLSLLLVVGNVLSALAPSFAVLLAARFIAGVPHGVYYGTASMVAASQVPPAQRTRAIGQVMLGLAAANVVGVPLMAFVGQALGWRVAFLFLAGLSLVVALLLPLAVPRVDAPTGASPRGDLQALLRPRVWLTLATATVGFGGMFSVYSYITPTLTEATGQPLSRVPWFLAAWGLGMVVGNVVGGRLADRAQTATIIGTLLWNVVCLGAFAVSTSSAAWMFTVLFLLGIGFALVPALQARLMDIAADAQSLAGSLNHSAFNLANAIGAWAGGLAIAAGLPWASTGAVGAALAFGGLVVFVSTVALRPLSISSTHPERKYS
ncbi:MFS transporter [Corallococcus exiguus]|uniref:MFS transporter n=1 Tax=Corallococcus exiguus TaxID=83462 RepID=UPI001495023E|nr:MFS transporter [Corallococcus exiguus]NPC71121.1 MFS transporter [Corallococcus exiguus]